MEILSYAEHRDQLIENAPRENLERAIRLILALHIGRNPTVTGNAVRDILQGEESQSVQTAERWVTNGVRL